ALGLDAIVCAVEFGGAGFGLGTQLGRGTGQAVGMVLGDQPTVGLVDIVVAGLAVQAEHGVGVVATQPEPVSVEGMADQQADDGTQQRVEPQQRGAGECSQQLSVPPFHVRRGPRAVTSGSGAKCTCSTARTVVHCPARSRTCARCAGCAAPGATQPTSCHQGFRRCQTSPAPRSPSPSCPACRCDTAARSGTCSTCPPTG